MEGRKWGEETKKKERNGFGKGRKGMEREEKEEEKKEQERRQGERCDRKREEGGDERRERKVTGKGEGEGRMGGQTELRSRELTLLKMCQG